MKETTDSKTLAYINMYGVLGSLSVLCDVVPEAKKILGKSGCSIGFVVKGGPQATLTFVGGRCLLTEGVEDASLKLAFSSCEKFNGMIDGTAKPFPTKGFTKLAFLLTKFRKLTDLLTKYLRPGDGMLDDPEFFRASTVIMFRVITASIVQIGNFDQIGRFSASNIPNGIAKLEIAGVCSAGIIAKDGCLSLCGKIPGQISSYMQFDSLKTARDIFDNRVNSIACLGSGKLRVGGMLPQIDNINRILSRAELYLA